MFSIKLKLKSDLENDDCQFTVFLFFNLSYKVVSYFIQQII